MAEKDIISKELLKQFTVDFANLIFGLDIDPERLELLDTESQRIEERRADFLARVRPRRGGEPFLLHIELQNDNRPDMPLRMLRYFTDIQLRWPGEPIQQYLLYIGRRPLKMADGLTQETWHYKYNLFDIRNIDCQTLIAQDTPDALVMAILCDFGEKKPQDVVNFIVQRLKILTGDDQGLFRRYFDMLEVLSTNRDLKGELKEAEKMLIELDRTQMPSYELGLERGLERGLEQGVKKGLEQGLKQGLQKGIAQGVEQGLEQARLAMARNLIALGKLDDATIAQVAELPLATIERLRREAEGSD